MAKHNVDDDLTPIHWNLLRKVKMQAKRECQMRMRASSSDHGLPRVGSFRSYRPFHRWPMWRSSVDKHGSGEGWRARGGRSREGLRVFVLACKGMRNGRGHVRPSVILFPPEIRRAAQESARRGSHAPKRRNIWRLFAMTASLLLFYISAGPAPPAGCGGGHRTLATAPDWAGIGFRADG